MNDEQLKIFDLLWPSYLGIPYLYGGASRLQGFDCSGLVIDILKSLEVLPPKYDATAQGLWLKFPNQVMDPEPGDLVFFGVTPHGINHVGLMISHSLMLEAGGGTSGTTTRHLATVAGAEVRLRPLSSRLATVGFKRPDYSF